MSPSVMDRKIAECEWAISYDFEDSELLREALQARGSALDAVSWRIVDERSLVEGNRRLALVGDAVIALFIRERAVRANETCGQRLIGVSYEFC